MTKECYKMSIEEAMNVVAQIIARGHDAEVRRCRGGQYIVYEIIKIRAERPDVGGRDDMA